MKILIIDDDIDTLRLVGMMLQKQGYQILAAANGVQGLAQAGSEYPDIILLDVMMPKLDGYGFVRELRRLQTAVQAPVMMVSTESQLQDAEAARQAGARDVIAVSQASGRPVTQK